MGGRPTPLAARGRFARLGGRRPGRAPPICHPTAPGKSQKRGFSGTMALSRPLQIRRSAARRKSPAARQRATRARRRSAGARQRPGGARRRVVRTRRRSAGASQRARGARQRAVRTRRRSAGARQRAAAPRRLAWGTRGNCLNDVRRIVLTRASRGIVMTNPPRCGRLPGWSSRKRHLVVSFRTGRDGTRPGKVSKPEPRHGRVARDRHSRSSQL